jgi:HEAT repeat protein
MTSCPICGKPVDSLRAPAVGVRDGKVVSYCSKECAALAESGPAKLQPTKVVRMPSSDERVSAQLAAVKPEAAVTPASGVPVAAPGQPDSAPVIEIIREPSRPVTVPAATAAERPRRRRRITDSVQIAETGSIDDFITPDEPPRRGLVIGVVLLVLAGGAAAAYFLGYFDKLLGKHEAAAPTQRDAAPVAIESDAPALVSAQAALERAKSVLSAQLATSTPRVQRVAASALARTRDQAALDALAAAIETEPGDLAKVELAYALARGGDNRGFDALVAAASPQKRDVKHEAGRRLALLGDVRAVRVLESSLAFAQFRLGVAEQLAFLKHARALQVLDATRADPKALPDEKARATIALGWAGRADVIPDLRELLADDRNNAFAAHALANLHDEAARPVLEKQLGIPSLRIHAARALRLLAPDADVAPLLPPLVAALDSNKDTEQAQIAETILLLVGPAAWSERE